MKLSATNFQNFSAEFFRKSTAIFPEISGKIPKEISGNFLTHIHSHGYFFLAKRDHYTICIKDRPQIKLDSSSCLPLFYSIDGATVLVEYYSMVTIHSIDGRIGHLYRNYDRTRSYNYDVSPPGQIGHAAWHDPCPPLARLTQPVSHALCR